MKVFQIGAAGGVGQPLTADLVRRGDKVTGMHRNPDQAQAITTAGGTPIIGDLIGDSVEELAAKITSHDAVVFSAGAHGTGMDQTTLIDGEGVEKAAQAAVQAGVTRFLLVSVIPEAARDQGLGEAHEHYMRVKKTADVFLIGTDLDWVILRPGTLTREPGTGTVSLSPALVYGSVPREDVAAVLAELLHRPEVSRQILELTEGPTPIADAVDAAIRS